MSDRYQIQGSATTSPISGASAPVGAQVAVEIDEALVLSVDLQRRYDLIDDAAVTVQLPGPTSSNPSAPQANVLIIQVTGPRVKATITTADGAAQVIPVDPLLVLHTETGSPITALTLTRTPGNETFCDVFLGQI